MKIFNDTLARMMRNARPLFTILMNNRGEADPTPAPEPTPEPTPEPAPDPNPNPEPSWMDTLPDDAKNDPEVNKYKTADEFYSGYKNKVEMIGKKGVIVPDENSTPEAKEAYLNALGRPETQEGYNIDVIEGLHESITVTPESTAAFNAIAHKMGFTNEQANGLNQWYLNAVSENAKAVDKAQTESMQTAETALRSEWGENYDTNKNAVANLIMKAGGQETIDAMGGAEGIGNNPHVLKALGKIAGMLSEDQIGNLKPSNSPQTGSETKEQAVAKINEINTQFSDPKSAIADPNHIDHSTAVSERTRLYNIAYGGSEN